jgi:hypothetical protein
MGDEKGAEDVDIKTMWEGLAGRSKCGWEDDDK